MKKKLLAALAGTIVSAALLIGGVLVYNYVEKSVPLEKVMTEQYGGRMADFELPDMEGNLVQVTASSGKPKLINFWASWCPGCKNETGHLNAIYEKYQDEIDIISVNVTTQDSVEEAQAFLDAYSVQLPTLLDQDGSVSAQYRITAIPTNFFVRGDGTIAQITYELTESGAEPFIQELLVQ